MEEGGGALLHGATRRSSHRAPGTPGRPPPGAALRAAGSPREITASPRPPPSPATRPSQPRPHCSQEQGRGARHRVPRPRLPGGRAGGGGRGPGGQAVRARCREEKSGRGECCSDTRLFSHPRLCGAGGRPQPLWAARAVPAALIGSRRPAAGAGRRMHRGHWAAGEKGREGAWGEEELRGGEEEEGRGRWAWGGREGGEGWGGKAGGLRHAR